MSLKDFIGFSFNGVHSSTLNIVRTSDGTRFNDNLTPNFTDNTAQIKGNDGMYYWNSFYSSRTWSVKIAFDSMTETQYRAMRQLFNTKNYGDLIFDELPYKKYKAKIQSIPTLTVLCFDNSSGAREYRGEGTIQFISYEPYGHSVYKFLSQYDTTIYSNKSQWSASTNMLTSQGAYDGTGLSINLYNPGDVATNWIAYYPITSDGLNLTQIQLTKNGVAQNVITFSTMSRQNTNDAYVRINSKTNLLEGCNSNKVTTGSLYNQFIQSGDFFKIPTCATTDNLLFLSTGTGCSEIVYDYLYY